MRSSGGNVWNKPTGNSKKSLCWSPSMCDYWSEGHQEVQTGSIFCYVHVSRWSFTIKTLCDLWGILWDGLGKQRWTFWANLRQFVEINEHLVENVLQLFVQNECDSSGLWTTGRPSGRPSGPVGELSAGLWVSSCPHTLDSLRCKSTQVYFIEPIVRYLVVFLNLKVNHLYNQTLAGPEPVVRLE